jgi:PBSX family phage terminase large subunit
MPEDKLYMMCAKSLTTLKRNCLILLQELVGEDNFTFSISAKEGQLFGRKILLEGANDSRSEAKIRGLTLQGAYCDELTQFPKDFFAMLLSRLRLPNAKLIATTNPDSPSHWLKTDYIDRQDELSFLDVRFLIDDNTTLPKDYVDNLKVEYTGVFYDRFIRGLWVLAEGLIYPMYEEAIEEPPIAAEGERCTPQAIHKVFYREAEQYVLSIDYGTLNAFAALLWGKYGNVWYAIDGYYYSGRDTGQQLTDEEYGQEIDIRFGAYSTEWEKLKVIVDPSAASFITLLIKKKKYKVVPADNDVINGIRETATALKKGLIKISPKIKEWKNEAAGYIWDDNPVEDRPVKIADHYMDSTRYFVKTSKIANPKHQYFSKI